MKLQALAIGLACLGTASARGNATAKSPNPGSKNPDYMVDNQHNYFGTAPDKGSQNGPVWLESGSFHNFSSFFSNAFAGNNSVSKYSNKTNADGRPAAMAASSSSSYWLAELAPKGKQPYAGANYKVFRNVVDDYGADNTGATDATEKINAAILDGNRCGEECGNTFSTGAVVYFPGGTYKICRPIVQLYMTQFVGDPNDRPILKGCDEFEGIALIDTDPYIPGGGGQNWYINQNQFFRQIRNFVFDLTEMPAATNDHDQNYVPTGLHWQVSQACALQNLLFKMPKGGGENSTHVGIFMENGSGGFVSDLDFEGGNIGWRAGSQQYTAMNLKFSGCKTAVQMVWDWGFNWQRIEIEGADIGFNISGRGGDTGQGTGSVSIIDSKISSTSVGILTNSRKDSMNGPPNIVIDNLELSGVGTAVKDEGGGTVLGASSHIDLWAIGSRYNGTKGSQTSGNVDAPKLADSLLDGGKLFYRSRPQYESAGVDKFLVATDHGCKNDGTGDNAAAINDFLSKAKDQNKIAFFPAGVYRVGSTVFIPEGSVVQGSVWSQIQGAGFYFNDIYNPKVVVQVGQKGDKGKMEIVEMMFSVQGATAGAIVLEWNIHEDGQGSAGMWDSHVRVGGATGSDLTAKNCPRREYSDNCICASLLFHVTPNASGYFENVWVWLADHDNDMSVYDEPDKTANQVSLYAARGTLIESKGPSWFYATGSEHAILYQYQLYNAKDIYLGHIQSETPYYQPNPAPPLPYSVGKPFPGDPDFSQCETESCQAAWGLRVIDSEGITIHSAGLYSFFQYYLQGCVDTHNCQQSICEVKGSKSVVMYNVFTVGSVDAVSGINNGSIAQKDVQNGFTTEISVWIPLEGDDVTNVVSLGTEIFSTPAATCHPPCTFVIPTSHMDTPTTISPGTYVTSFEYGDVGTSTLGNGAVVTVFLTSTTTTTLTLPVQTVSGMGYYNVNVTASQTTSDIILWPSVPLPDVTVMLPDGKGGSTPRVVPVPPWPEVTKGPPGSPGWFPPGGGGDDKLPEVYHTPYTTTLTATGPTVMTLSFPAEVSSTTFQCPPDEDVTFNTPRTTIRPTCDGKVTTFAFKCPQSRLVTFLGPSVAAYTADCTLSTVIPTSVPTTTTPPTSTSTTTPPVWTTWPNAQITGVTTPVPSKTVSNGHVIVPCHVWFFNFCPSGIYGWSWSFPSGIIGPGPPPPTILPDWKIKGDLPPWPKITIKPGPEADYEDKPEKCEPETATGYHEIITTTKIVKGSTTETESVTKTETVPIVGCSATDTTSTSTSITTRTDCPVPTPPSKRDLEGREDGPPPPGCAADAIVYPKNPERFSSIRSRLEKDYAGKYNQIGGGNYVLFWYVPQMDPQTLHDLTQMADVGYAYYNEEYNERAGPLDEREVDDTHHDHAEDGSHYPTLEYNGTVAESKHEKRDGAGRSISKFWPASQVSSPPGLVWPSKWDIANDVKGGGLQYRYTQPSGEDQWVYVIGEVGVWEGHNEFKGVSDKIYNMYPSIPLNPPEKPGSNDLNENHGQGIISKIIGNQLGICPKCKVGNLLSRRVKAGGKTVVYQDTLVGLQDALDDINDPKDNKAGRAVISISFSHLLETPVAHYISEAYILKKLAEVNVPVVVASANHAKTEQRPISRYPAKYGNPDDKYKVPNVIAVGSTDEWGREAPSSQYADWMTTSAPANDAWVAYVSNEKNPDPDGYRKASGTSYAAPQVAALIAYYRSLKSDWKDDLKDPAMVKRLIQIFQRYLETKPGRWEDKSADKLKVIWNGQIGDHSCLADYATRDQWEGGDLCPKLTKDLSQTPCDTSPKKRDINARADSCPIRGSGGNDGPRQTITYTSGAKPSPTCPSGTDCGGRLCTGYFCSPNPTGAPPGFHDPKDPNHDSGGGGDNGPCKGDSDCSGQSCPSGQHGICRNDSCTCSNDKPPGDACRGDTDCINYSCNGVPNMEPYCDASKCTCKKRALAKEEVRIFYRDIFLTSGESGGDWAWFESKDGEVLELCQQNSKTSIKATGPENPDYPPDMMSPVDIWGHYNCKYISKEGHPGQFHCDQTPATDCYTMTGTHLNCTEQVEIDDYYPKVRCPLPAGV